MGWLARWWPAVVWAIVISLFSTSAFTAERTSHFIIPILHWIFPGASADALDLMHHYIRKSAHFCEYFVFSLLVLRAIRGSRHTTRLTWALATVAIVFGYAALDEFHQSFVPGRTPLFTDVLIDTTGGAIAQIGAAILLLRDSKRRES
jgi:VanZ family protein